MSYNYEKYRKIRVLVCELNEGLASPEGMAELNSILANDPEAVEYYVDIIDLQTYVRSILSDSAIESTVDVASDDMVELMLSLVENENNACPIEFPESIIDNDEQVVKAKKEVQKIRKFYRVYSTIVSIAAVLMVMFIVYANLFPPQYTVPVATLVDHIDAQWNNTSDKLNVNDRILINQPSYILDGGIVKISYDDGVELIIEGPAEFTIEKKGISLISGSLFSHVPRSGIGFTVNTANARFIDLGTDFGVYAGSNESSELHVLKGEVQYCSCFPDAKNSSKTIKENNARRFIAQANNIEVIPVAVDYFVCQMDSQSGVVWRGQKEMDLADIVGGGNGFGTGQLNATIGTTDGVMSVKRRQDIKLSEKKGDGKYHLASKVRYVDGVFVPDISTQISSDGYVCNDFPDTSGLYSCDLLFGSVYWPARPLVLDGIEYGTDRNHSLFMHANLGVTFDLDEIRSDLKGVNIREFRARAGISESANGLDWANVDIWIFLDGELGYKKQEIKRGQIEDIFVVIPDHTRFLTIAVTEGGEHDPAVLTKKVSKVSSDWCVFANPVLSFE